MSVRVKTMVCTLRGLCPALQSLFNSVMVVGGNSLLSGFSDRINVDLVSRIPPVGTLWLPRERIVGYNDLTELFPSML